MVRQLHLALAIVAIASAAALAEQAGAQCRLCDVPATSRAEVVPGQDIRVEVETSIDFDRVIFGGSGTGSAVMRPDGSITVQGAVAGVSPRAMVGSAIVHGQPGRAVRVELPRRIVLHSLSGGEISLDDVTDDLPSLPRLDSTGTLNFRFGGRLTVSGDADGDYRGDLPITVEYL